MTAGVGGGLLGSWDQVHVLNGLGVPAEEGYQVGDGSLVLGAGSGDGWLVLGAGGDLLIWLLSS